MPKLSDYLELHATSIGQLIAVHPIELCKGPACVIHRPTPHHMRTWPLIWNPYLGVMLRQCEHGVMHIDPDDQQYGHAHICPCACCIPPVLN